MNYRDLSTDERMVTAGDIAQGQAESFFTRHGLSFRPFGVEHLAPEDRTPADRYRPDYDVEGYGLVEVMSVGPNGHLRIKTSKLDGLSAWKPYRFWVYDPTLRQGGWLSRACLMILCFEGKYEPGAFQDEVVRPYYDFRKADLWVEWEPATTFIESGWHRE